MADRAPNAVAADFDRRHRRHRCVWGTAPDALAHAAAAHLSLRGARVLDAGCGDGRNAAFFARRGATVRALDLSPAAVATARATWAATPRIEWELGDVRDVPLPAGRYDLVFACSLLQWLATDAEVADVLSRLKRTTRPGGVHALTTFNERLPYDPPAGEVARPCLLPHRWFVDRYRDWTLLEASDTTLSSEGHSGNAGRHEHAVTTVIARRPPRVAARRRAIMSSERRRPPAHAT